MHETRRTSGWPYAYVVVSLSGSRVYWQKSLQRFPRGTNPNTALASKLFCILTKCSLLGLFDCWTLCHCLLGLLLDGRGARTWQVRLAFGVNHLTSVNNIVLNFTSISGSLWVWQHCSPYPASNVKFDKSLTDYIFLKAVSLSLSNMTFLCVESCSICLQSLIMIT